MSALVMAAGSLSMTVSNTRAAPSGLRLCCSRCEQGQQKRWNILAAVIRDCPVAGTLAVAFLGDGD
jgi:hypothetical protein